MVNYKTLSCLLLVSLLLFSCSRDTANSSEEISLAHDTTAADTSTSISLSPSSTVTYPNEVLLTGLKEQRLVTIYRKVKISENTMIEQYAGKSFNYYDEYSPDHYKFFMPGIDLQLGYNLVNVAHYNFKTQETKLLFDKPAIIRSVYYPSFEQDSLDKKPINRNYFFVSAYNEDTNQDTLLNKKDLRRFFMFNADASQQKLLIPANYSVVRSQYDAGNDVMYIFARHDANNNGRSERSEPLHVFWISLAKPEEGKRVY